MFRNHYITIAAWIIVYISLWLSRDNLVSSKFSKNNCHTGFVSRIIETMIFPFQWYKNRPTYEYVVGLVLLCCISVVAVIKCFSVFSSIEQPMIETSVYKGYKRDKIEMRGDRAEISDFPLYLNTVAGGLDCRDQTIGGFSFVVKIYAVPVVEIIG